MSASRKPGLDVLHARYRDLEARNFLDRVRAALIGASEDNRDVSDAIRERVRGAAPDAFRIVAGPHEEWREDVAMIFAYLVTPDGLPTREATAGLLRLWWELDASETHVLSVVMVDAAGNETALDMAQLAITYDAVRVDHPAPGDETGR